ncbi:MAG: hypothetical protein BWY76_02712 [bacterium ADurb.Bin429]|nr:MAG: hypothetical protein BWY76_02712 [bacterium ADurb.Bin429]
MRAISRYVPVRRWTPKEQHVDLTFNLPQNQFYPLFFHLTDAKGRTAITPIVRLQWAPGYLYRCSDRQNFFGFAVNYTGTVLPDVNIDLPAFGTGEGRGFWPSQRGPRRGENLAPLIEFPFASDAVTITDAKIDQRYYHALWEDVAFDGKASQGTTRSRVYEAKVRYYDYHHESFYTFTRTSTRPMMVIQADIRLRIPVAPEGDIFPAITSVKPQPEYEYRDPKNGEMVTGKLTQGYLDLPAGGRAEEFVALTPGFRVLANGRIGFAAPAWVDGALPAGTAWSGRFVKLPPAKIKSLRVQMGLTPDTPYTVTLARGTLRQLVYVAEMDAADGAVAGMVKPAPKPKDADAKDPEKDEVIVGPAQTPMTYALPLTITGMNGNWDTRVWREDGSLTPFAVFEGAGHARLDVTEGGKFYAGPLVIASEAPNLRITVLEWDAAHIKLELNNTTDAPMESILRTPAEITGKFPLNQQVSVPSGSMKVVEYK